MNVNLITNNYLPIASDNLLDIVFILLENSHKFKVIVVRY